MAQDGMPGPGVEQAFRLEEERVGNATVVLTLAGEVDLHSAPELRERLGAAIDEGFKAVVVDLAKVTFVDSMTLGVLLGALKRLRPSGGHLRVVVSDPSLRRIFEITLLDKVFALYESRAAALEQ